MKTSELIAAVGDDKVQVQFLDECGITLDWDHKKGTRITFGTEMPLDSKGTEMCGMIVWMDRAAVKDALDRAIASEKSDAAASPLEQSK